MCTVTYLPYGTGFILTSNRDEAPHRSPKVLSELAGPRGQRLYLPRDTSGGSWIVASSSGRVACLLNGAYERHNRHPPYRRSRGLVVLDAFAYETLTAFWDNYDFVNIEPFTLLLIDQGLFLEGRWDGQRVWLTQVEAAQPQLWASATLYDANRRAERKQWFRDWLADHDQFTVEAIHHFHKTGGVGDRQNDLVMLRPEGVQTVSVSQVVRTNTYFGIAYDH
ncbi:MAG: NRDE family protein, partial [Bacteroidota bacterium]